MPLLCLCVMTRTLLSAAYSQADGSEEHRRPNAPAEEPPTIAQRSLSNSTLWDPPRLAPGATATLLLPLAGAELGDPLFCGHSGLTPGVHRVQLSAMSGEGVVEALLHNAGTESVDIPGGRLRVVIMQVL